MGVKLSLGIIPPGHNSVEIKDNFFRVMPRGHNSWDHWEFKEFKRVFKILEIPRDFQGIEGFFGSLRLARFNEISGIFEDFYDSIRF